MDSSLDKLIELNSSGLVMLECKTSNIFDMEQVNLCKEWLKHQIISQMEQENAGVESLSRIMDEKLELLREKLKNGESIQLPSPTLPSPALEEEVEESPPEEEKKPMQSSGYKPKSEDMSTKLANERKPVKKIILEDCIQLGLLDKKRANYLVTQMAGKEPMEAEREVVTELRANLHSQVRKLIRKDKGGPWSSPIAQEELRLEIVQTPTVRSMVYLTREILQEREEWKNKSRSSITGRIFGNRMTLDK